MCMYVLKDSVDSAVTHCGLDGPVIEFGAGGGGGGGGGKFCWAVQTCFENHQTICKTGARCFPG